MKIVFVTSMITFFVLNISNAQIFRHFKSEELERTFYSSDEWKKKIREKEIEFEQYFANEYLLFEKDDQGVINIQVVFNILQTEDKKITHDQIKTQLKALNAAFNNEIKMLEDDFYRDKAYSAGIQFCVPDYNETFIRTLTLPSGTEFKTLFSERGEKGLEPFQPDKYINIWVADLGQIVINGVQEFSTAGYAQLPLRDSQNDGIVIDIDHFGEQPTSELYQKGYTLAHLMGIYLGIKPLWGLDGEGQCGGDGVDDTPEINVGTLVCLPQREDYYLATGCFGNLRRMNKNFMDNVPDECVAMFTLGQRRKMQGNLGKKGPRGYLVSETKFSCNDGKVTGSQDFISNSNGTISVTPNPAYDRIKVMMASYDEISTGQKNYVIYDLTGQIKSSGTFESSESEIKIDEFTSGMYFLLVFDNLKQRSPSYSTTFEVIK